MKVRKLAVSLTLALAGAGVLATSLPMGAVAAQSPAVSADADGMVKKADAQGRQPGERGPQGERGPRGEHGHPGYPGGACGPDGEHGPRGAGPMDGPGAGGAMGAPGARGPMGHPGGPGMMGPMGGAMGLFGFSPFGMQPFVGAPPKPADLVAQGKMSAEKAAKIEKEMQARAEKRARWMEHRMEKRIDDVIESIDGTPDQAKRIGTIAKAAMADMKPLAEQLRSLDERGAALVKADTLDRNAFESLRQERLKLMDQMSQRSTAAWLDMASVLKPEQRQKLMEQGARPPRFGGFFGGHGPKGFGGPGHDMKRPNPQPPGEASENLPPPADDMPPPPPAE